MESFFSYFRKYGFKLWLVNLLGYLASMVLYFLMILIFLLIGLVLGLGALTTIFSSSSPEAFLNQFGESMSIGVAIGVIVFIIFWILAMYFPLAFQTSGQFAVVSEIFQSNQLQIGTFFSKGLRNIWKMFRLIFYLVLIQLPVGVLLTIGIFLTTGVIDYGLWIGITLILITAVIDLFLILASSHAQLIMIAENTGPIQALLLSLQVALKHFGKILVTAFLVGSVTVLFIIGGLIIYLPLIFSLIDPTGILMILLSILAYLLQWGYYIIGVPLLVAFNSLIIAYRYFKYLRPDIFQNQIAGNQEPIFSFKNE